MIVPDDEADQIQTGNDQVGPGLEFLGWRGVQDRQRTRQPSRPRRLEPGHRVLDHQTVLGCDPQPLGGQQERVRMRLASLDHRGSHHGLRPAQTSGAQPRLEERVRARGDDRNVRTSINQCIQGLGRAGQDNDPLGVSHLERLDPAHGGRLCLGVEMWQQLGDHAGSGHAVKAEQGFRRQTVLCRPRQPGPLHGPDRVDEGAVEIEEDSPEGALRQRRPVQRRGIRRGLRREGLRRQRTGSHVSNLG